MIKYLLSLGLLVAIFAGCKKESYDDLSLVATGQAPAKLNALFTITQDNSGLVTIVPNGEAAVRYEVYFGDGTTAPALVNAGSSVQHTYAEGQYSVKVVGYDVTGIKTELTKPLTVTFRAPENLMVTATIDPANRYKLNVSATALYETYFQVYFGDVPNEVPQNFNEGDVKSHIYPAVGAYTLRVVALSGGAATTTFTTTINIVDPVLLPITFQSTTVNYNWINFDGGVTTVINNPQQNGINTSTRVARMVKNAGQPWGGSLIKVDGGIDFSANRVMLMKVYSPRVGAKVLFKVENATNPGINFEKEVLTTVANTWETLAFDYRQIPANTYDNIVLIFDNGTVGDGSANFTWLIDDIAQTNNMPTSILTLPVTFDMPGINYEVTDFGGNSSEPATAPGNPGNNVKKTTKTNGAATWAGTTIGSGFSAPIGFTATRTQMSVRVYSPAAGKRVRLKVEDRTNPARSVETEAMTQAANTWETLIFDFSTPSDGTAALNLAFTYNMASIFFDFGNAGAGDIYYWDDVTFLTTNVTPNYLALPIDFQATGYAYNFINFGGATSTVADNPSATGINTSTKVGKYVKGPPEVWAGSFLQLVNPINFSTLRTFKVKVYSPRAGAKLLLKVENATNGGIAFEREATVTAANTWEDLTFDFSGINVGNFYSKIVVFFDFGTVGDGSPNFTYYFDDIRLN